MTGERVGTQWLKVDWADPGDGAIRLAAQLLREGKLVAFPTETVYGLGARAGDEAAVRAIFSAKGRPSGVPLIVHVSGLEQAAEYVTGMPEVGRSLAREHWPGPLTLVTTRSSRVPDAVTAGGETVGVRAPRHPVALALIEVLGEGIAAPSANLYNRLPPVRAEHVMRGLGGRIDAVLDGGLCPGGLESTVVDIRSQPAVVLRRGAVEASRLGLATREQASPLPGRVQGAWLRVGDAAAFGEWVQAESGEVGRLCLGHGTASVRQRVLGEEPGRYAAEMYDALHALWEAGCSRVWVDAPPRDARWRPIWDRLARLATSLPAP